MGLITTAEAKEAIPGLTGTGEDGLVGGLIDAVSGYFAAWCGYPPASAQATPTMESATYTLYLEGPDPDDSSRLHIGVRPFSAITSIHDSYGQRVYDSTTLVASTDYTLWEDEGEVTLDYDSTHGAWSRHGKYNIKVIGTGGWTTIPEPVKTAARLGVRAVWDERRRQGVASRSGRGSTITLRNEDRALLQPIARELLAHYRLPGVWLG